MKEYFLDLTTVSDAELEQWYYQMQPSRREKCRHLKKELSQKQCIAADHLARSALSESLNLPMEDIKIKVSPEGKPYLEGNPIYFSISHSENRIACITSTKPVGIDIEYIRPVPQEVPKRICTPREWEYLLGSKDAKEREARFISLWTRKEAVFKMDGRLPRRDSETEVLTDSETWTINTKIMDNYAISVAKRRKL